MARLFQFSAFLFFLVVSTSPTFAQNEMEARNGFEEGFRSVQFGIGNSFTLTSFNSSNISYMKYNSENKSTFLRLSFRSTYSTSESEYSYEYVDEDDLYTDIDTQEIKTFYSTVSTRIGTQDYLETQSDVLPFLTKSAFLGFTYSRSTREYFDEDQNAVDIDTDLSETEDTFIAPFVGIGIGFGVEYFIAKNISLHAQTGFDLEYQYNSTDYLRDETRRRDGILLFRTDRDQENKAHSFGLNSTGVLFGVSAFF